MLGKSLIGLLLVLVSYAGASAQERRDEFYYLGEMNKASTVMVVEQGIVPKALGKTIAESVFRVIADGDKAGAKRPGDYLELEKLLIAAGGPDVTRMHSGRSRQDIGATRNRLFQRMQVLTTLAALNNTRAALLDMAAKHPNAIVPAYTVGVQAQPISFGHYILAYTEALERNAERLRRAFVNVNRSPLGAAALGTSSFPVNRPRLAELLGFDGIVENSLDANQIAPIDTGVELVSVASAAALTVGTLISDLEAQYRMTTPWLTLEEGELTGTSSIMPQKRNPNALHSVRVGASEVLGISTTYLFKAHNVPHGLGDYKGSEPVDALNRMARTLNNLTAVVKQLNFNAQRALDEVDDDYATTTELADILQRDADVPFRVGHHFASELVNFGRRDKLRPRDIPYAQARMIYTEAAKHFRIENAQLPLSEAQFRKSLTAENMVQSARVIGGPQPDEVQRMLAAQRTALKTDREWLESARGKLDDASRKLDKAFAALKSES
ncbi:MAG TPA: argininosuccinate lyase [Candidatus Binatia bacterium]|nr:argininosuccinate lyase [Candidatus Binatia bacterium]